MTPRVSVLMTIYNAEPYLARALDSVCAQTFKSWELIAVENGSTDGSAATLAGYTDTRIRRVELPANVGRTPALRIAFEQARGEYIAVLDADDTCAATRLEKQSSFLDAHPDVVLLGTWARYIDGQDQAIGEWTPPAQSAALRELLGSHNPVVHSSAMYRAAQARAVGGYPADLPYGQDLALWLKLMKTGDPAVLPEYLCGFRVLPQSMTRSGRYRVTAARDKLILLEQVAAELPSTGRVRELNRQELAIARLRYSVALLRSGRILAGLRGLIDAVGSDPRSLLVNRITRAMLHRE